MDKNSVATESPSQAAEAASLASKPVDRSDEGIEDVIDAVLIEDISIDGMCGVY